MDPDWVAKTRKELGGELEAAAVAVEETHKVLVNDRTTPNQDAYQAALDYQTSCSTVYNELGWW